MAASPVVAGDLVVLVCDQQTGSFVFAVDRITGRQRGCGDPDVLMGHAPVSA
jgi:hypothetical protein